MTVVCLTRGGLVKGLAGSRNKLAAQAPMISNKWKFSFMLKIILAKLQIAKSVQSFVLNVQWSLARKVAVGKVAVEQTMERQRPIYFEL